MATRHPALRLLHHWPTRLLCLFIIILQAVSINWYLMDNLGHVWAAMYAADAIIVALFLVAMLRAKHNFHKEKHADSVMSSEINHMPLTYAAWFVYSVVLCAKVSVIFSEFSTDLDEDSFFGPNTLQSSLALSGIVFLSFLPTQHDLRGGRRKDLVLSLTGTVGFDILDGVDILENLYEYEVRDAYHVGLDDASIAIFCVNAILPTLPLFTLAKMKFGLKKLPRRLELLHKFAVAYIVNLPLFVLRMITWHSVSQGISIFALKNIIIMGATAFEMLENCFTQTSEDEESEQNEHAVDQHAHETTHIDSKV